MTTHMQGSASATTGWAWVRCSTLRRPVFTDSPQVTTDPTKVDCKVCLRLLSPEKG